MIDLEEAEARTASVKFDPQEVDVFFLRKEEEKEKVEYDYSYKFSRVGVVNMKGSHLTNNPDVLDLISEMSKPASSLFIDIKNSAVRSTNISILDKPKGSSGATRSRAVKELIGINLIAKAGVRTFMINPHYIQPAVKDGKLKASHQEWFQLTGEALSTKIE